MSENIQILTTRGNDSTQLSAANSSVVITLLPIMAAVFVAFLVIGLAMPVLPLHVHDGLGLSTFVVGLVAGAQFTASLISRFWSGTYADSRGGKRAVIAGLLMAAVAGLLYFLSLRFVDEPTTSVTILLIGRGLLGGAESFIITGALSWGLALGGAENAGKVMAWIGTAMYVAFAIGAPTGSALFAVYGFTAIALATTLIPLATLLIVLPRSQAATRSREEQPALSKIIGAVWMPGVGLALSSIGFGAVTTFVVLLFVQRGWGLAWLGLTAFATAFIVARVFFGHLADKIGGAKVAFFSVLLEAVGLALVWLAPWSAIALIGVTLAGLGYSLVYPAYGVEAVRRAPAESRGLAMGAYSAFLDLALGLANPALGLVAGRGDLKTVFFISAVVVILSSAIAAWMLKARLK